MTIDPELLRVRTHELSSIAEILDLWSCELVSIGNAIVDDSAVNRLATLRADVEALRRNLRAKIYAY